MTNPWIPSEGEPTPPVRITGAAAPQPGLTPPRRADRLPTFAPTVPAPLWVIGAHGGAGESTVAALVGGEAAGHRWPEVSPPPPVLLVARTAASGIAAARTAARAWASGATPPVRMLGLVWVADAPGRLPRSLADEVKLVSGSVPHTWRLRWSDELRLVGHEAVDAAARSFTAARLEIQALLSTEENR